MASPVIPPIVVSAAAESWFYRNGKDALATGIPVGAKVFHATGQPLEIVGTDLSVVDWPLDSLVQCAVDHAGWSDQASVRRKKLHHWLIFVPCTLFRLGINSPHELFRVGVDLFRNR